MMCSPFPYVIVGVGYQLKICLSMLGSLRVILLIALTCHMYPFFYESVTANRGAATDNSPLSDPQKGNLTCIKYFKRIKQLYCKKCSGQNVHMWHFPPKSVQNEMFRGWTNNPLGGGSVGVETLLGHSEHGLFIKAPWWWGGGDQLVQPTPAHTQAPTPHSPVLNFEMKRCNTIIIKCNIIFNYCN